MTPIGLAVASIPPCIAASWTAVHYRAVLVKKPNTYKLQFLAGLIVLFGRDKRSQVDRAMDVLKIVSGVNSPAANPEPLIGEVLSPDADDQSGGELLAGDLAADAAQLQHEVTDPDQPDRCS